MRNFWATACALLLIAVSVSNAGAEAEGKNVLFIGNSFTYYNNGLHNHFNRFVRRAGVTGEERPTVRIMTISGARLSEHAPALVPMLKRTKWDVVVLQGHSYETIGRNSRAHFRRAVRTFHKQIRDSGASTALYMTWAYEDKPEMTAVISEAYSDIGKSLNAIVVPVGLAFEKAGEVYPDIDLILSDKKHPSLAGTYLAAAVFFGSLYEASPAELNYVPRGLTKDSARKLREIAWQTIEEYRATKKTS